MAKKKAGRPRATLTEKQVTELGALAAYLTQEQIADYFGITDRTLRNIFEREPDIYSVYKQGAVKAIARSAQTLTKIAWGYKDVLTGPNNEIVKDENGDPVETYFRPDKAALMFHLKTKGGWRETDRLELTGKDGGAIKHQNEEPEVDFEGMSKEALIELRDAMARARERAQNGDGDKDGSTLH